MSQSDYSTQSKTMAFPASELSRLSHLLATYGSNLPYAPLKPNSPLQRCIVGGRDQEEGELILRSLSYPTTASTTPLADGRHAFTGYWSLSILAAVETGNVIASEITPEQLSDLTPAIEL